MRKKSGDKFVPVQVNPITGEYFITIPEEIISELDWYEDTEIKISLEGSELVLTERID